MEVVRSWSTQPQSLPQPGVAMSLSDPSPLLNPLPGFTPQSPGCHQQSPGCHQQYSQQQQQPGYSMPYPQPLSPIQHQQQQQEVFQGSPFGGICSHYSPQRAGVSPGGLASYLGYSAPLAGFTASCPQAVHPVLNPVGVGLGAANAGVGLLPPAWGPSQGPLGGGCSSCSNVNGGSSCCSNCATGSSSSCYCPGCMMQQLQQLLMLGRLQEVQGVPFSAAGNEAAGPAAAGGGIGGPGCVWDGAARRTAATAAGVVDGERCAGHVRGAGEARGPGSPAGKSTGAAAGGQGNGSGTVGSGGTANGGGSSSSGYRAGMQNPAVHCHSPNGAAAVMAAGAGGHICSPTGPTGNHCCCSGCSNSCRAAVAHTAVASAGGVGWMGGAGWGIGGSGAVGAGSKGSVAMPIVPHHPWHVVMDH